MANFGLIRLLMLVLICVSPRGDRYKEYLERHSTKILLDIEEFNYQGLFEDDIKTKRIFFSSEEHAVAKNKALEISLLKYFVKHADVKYLLIEHGYSASMTLNKYLASGEEEVLLQYVQELKGTLSYTKQFFDYWKKVYKLSTTLPTEKKIKVVGIDLGWSSTDRRYLNESLGDLNLEHFPRLKILLNGSSEALSKEEKADLYKEILLELKVKGIYNMDENQLIESTYIIKNLLYSLNAFSQEEHLDIHRKRDAYMYENFLELFRQLPDGNYFGQWGLNHVFQATQLEVNWLAYYLNADENSPVKGQVMSIATFYNDSERVKWKSEETQGVDSFIVDTDTLGLRLEPNCFYLFKLNGHGSPFSRKLYWFFPNPPKNGVTTDFFQYLVVGNKLSASDTFSESGE